MPAAEAATPLLSRAEQILYGRLVRAFPGHVILSQVALSRLVRAARRADVPLGASQSGAADFVVCRSDFTAIAVVELDGAAKRRDSQRTRERKDDLLRRAGIKVVRVAGADMLADIPNESALKTLVATLPLYSSTALLARKVS